MGTLALLLISLVFSPPARALDVQSATAAEMAASGAVDEAMARRLVIYRSIHGPFSDASWIYSVPGMNHALASRLLTTVSGAPSNAPRRFACGNVSDDYRILLDRVAEKDPELAQLLGGDPPPVEAIQASLRDMAPSGARVVEFFASDTMLSAYIISAEGTRGFAWSARRAEIDYLIAELWLRMTSNEDNLERVQEILSQLHRIVFAPIRHELGSDSSLLYIVMDGPFYYLPFQALYDASKRQYLVEERPIAYIPTAATLEYALLKGRPVSGEYRAFAVPEVPGWPSIPSTLAEVRLAARFFDRPTVLMGSQATEAVAVAPVPPGAVLHFACHASLHPTDPMAGAVRLWPADGSDGALTLNEISSADYRGASLALLSACETNVDGSLSAGRSILALSRSFLYAGVPTVIASQWVLNDEATAHVSTHFFNFLRNEGLGKAEALRAAQREIIKRPVHNHPRYWAALQLIGDAR